MTQNKTINVIDQFKIAWYYIIDNDFTFLPLK